MLCISFFMCVIFSLNMLIKNVCVCVCVCACACVYFGLDAKFMFVFLLWDIPVIYTNP